MAKKKKNFDLKLAFEKFDVNADGTIEPHELNMVLREIGIELNQKEMDLVFARFDPDGGGDIAYQEFAWVFNNRRALKKAAQGKASNLGRSQSLPNIQKNKKSEHKEDEEENKPDEKNLTVKRPQRRRQVIGNTRSLASLKGGQRSMASLKGSQRSMASLKGSHAGSIKMGSLTAGKSGESLPPSTWKP